MRLTSPYGVLGATMASPSTRSPARRKAPTPLTQWLHKFTNNATALKTLFCARPLACEGEARPGAFDLRTERTSHVSERHHGARPVPLWANGADTYHTHRPHQVFYQIEFGIGPPRALPRQASIDPTFFSSSPPTNSTPPLSPALGVGGDKGHVQWSRVPIC